LPSRVNEITGVESKGFMISCKAGGNKKTQEGKILGGESGRRYTVRKKGGRKKRQTGSWRPGASGTKKKRGHGGRNAKGQDAWLR